MDVNFEKCVCSLLLFIIYYNLVAPRKLETRVYNIMSVIVTKNGTDKIQNVQPIVIFYDAYYMYNVYCVKDRECENG